MKFISLGKLEKKFLIPIIGGIHRLLFTFLNKKNPKYNIFSKNPFIASSYSSIGMILAFIPYLIIKHRSKKSSINSNELQEKSKLKLELIHTPLLYNITFNKYKYFLYQEIFDLLQTLSFTFFSMNTIYSFWTFDIIFISIFSYLLLKTKLYMHQYISIITIIIMGLLLNVIEYFKQSDNANKLDLIEILLNLFCEMCLSILMVIAKYNMETTFCSPYEICIWNGLIGLVIYIIILLIINHLELEIAGIKHPDNFYELFDNYDIYDFLLCLSFVVGQAIYNIVLFVTCDYFTPYHILIFAIFKESYNSFTLEGNTALNFLTFFILIIIAFMFLIFIEIIELNICNISYNTKKNIELRSLTLANKEMRTMSKINDEISVDDYGDEMTNI